MGNLLADFAFGYSQEVKDDVEDKEHGANILRPEDPLVANVEVNGCVVGRRETRVGNNNEHGSVPEGQEWLWLDEESLLEGELRLLLLLLLLALELLLVLISSELSFHLGVAGFRNLTKHTRQ